MARFYVDLTIWFSAEILDDDDLARVYPDIATRMKGKYGVQSFNLRQAPEAQEEIIEQPLEEQLPLEQQDQPLEQQQPEELEPEVPIPQLPKIAKPVVTPNTPPPQPATQGLGKKQPKLAEEEEEEDEYEQGEEQQ